MRWLIFASLASLASSECLVNNRATECLYLPNNKSESIDKICENGTAQQSTSLKLVGHSNAKTLGHNPFEQCSEVEVISISSSTISILNKDSFSDFKKLKELHLYGNSLTKIESEAIVNLPNLENLTLNDNAIDTIGDRAFNCLPNLKILDLRGNRLKKFRASLILTGANNLKIITLHQNNISEVGEDSFKGLHQLEEIDLSSNPLGNISDGAFVDMTQLKKLNLKNEKLGHYRFARDGHRLKNFTAPLYFKNSSNNLEYLDLTMNDISEVTAHTFARLEHLKELWLTFNKISKISEGALEKLNELTLLHLSWNPLKNFSSCFYFKKASRLEKLYLAGNGIVNISNDAFSCTPHLTHLYISTSQLGSNIPKGIFANMMDLKSLVLQKIELQEFSAPDLLENTRNIEKLNLGFNKISTINSRSFKGLPHLKELILEYNTINTIEIDAFKYSKELEILDLSHNKITSFILPHAGYDDYLPKLKEVNLLKNPFTVVPSEFFSVLKSLEKLRIFQDEFYCKCLNDTNMRVPSSKNVYLYNDDEEYPNYRVYGIMTGSAQSPSSN